MHVNMQQDVKTVYLDKSCLQTSYPSVIFIFIFQEFVGGGFERKGAGKVGLLHAS